MRAEEQLTEFLLTVKDLANLLSISQREVWRREQAGKIPRALRLGRRTVRWKATEVEAYLQNLGHER